MISIDRRDSGSALHEFGRLSLHALFEHGKWPNVEKTMAAVLRSGGGKDIQGDPVSFMKGKGYPHLVDDIGLLIPKARMFVECFEFNADNRIGNEAFVAIGPDMQIANYFDVPPGGYHGRVDWAELSSASDPVPNQLRVIDFKNRPAIHPQAELRAHEQLCLYAWLLAAHYPVARSQNVIIGIYYFEYGKTDTVELTWAEVEANVERLMTRIRHKKNLKLKQIEPEPGFGRCQYCDFLVDCPKGLAMLDGSMMAPVDLESAKKVAQTLFVLDEIRDAAREGLKKFCEEHGPVNVADDTGYGFVTQPEYTVNAKAAILLLRKHKIDPMEVLKIDRTALERLAKKKENGEIREELEALIKVERTKTVFKEFKPEKADVVTGPRQVRGRVKRRKKESA